MSKYNEAFTNMIAAQTLAEAKNVSKYLRKNTSLSIDARNKIAESYFKKSLKEKFSHIYSEGSGAIPSVFETFIATIGAWANELFGALGTVLKVIVSGMMKLYDFFFGAGGALNFSGGSTGPGVLSRVIGKVGGMNITGGQALFMAAIFGLMIWGIYKVCSWLKKKSQFSESYIPMFTEDDESFLQKLVSETKGGFETAKGKVGEFGGKVKEKAGMFGGMISGIGRKFATMCVKKGASAYKAAKKYAYDPVIAKISPKYQQFMDIVGPKFAAMKADVLTKVDKAGEWISGYNPMKLRAKLRAAGDTTKGLKNDVVALGDKVAAGASALGDLKISSGEEIDKLIRQRDTARRRAKALGKGRRAGVSNKVARAGRKASIALGKASRVASKVDPDIINS